MNEYLREPPANRSAEESVIGSLMIDHGALVKIGEWLHEDDFFFARSRMLFHLVKQLITDGRRADAVTLGELLEANNLGDSVADLSLAIDIANATPSSENIEAYAQIVKAASMRRNAIDIGTELAGAGFDRGVDMIDAIALAQAKLSSLSTSTSKGGGLSPVKGALGRIFANMQHRLENPGLIGLSTPWDTVNELTSGLCPATTYFIAGRPSMGKTIVGGNIAAHLALHGHRGAFFSLEMTSEALLERFLAAEARVPHRFIRQPHDSSEAEEYWTRITDAMTRLTRSPMLIEYTPRLSWSQLEARARREHAKSPLKWIVVDHLHEFSIDKRRDARMEYADIAKGAHDLAGELNIPVVMLAQLNRATASRTDKRPTMADLRESGAIEEKADVILLLHRDDYYDRNTHMKGVVEVIPAKGRDLPVGDSLYLENRYAQMRADQWEGPLPLPAMDEETTPRKPRKGWRNPHAD